MKKKGFTLVEFLVAMTIATTVTLMITRSLKSFIGINDAIKTKVEMTNSIESINTLLTNLKNTKVDIVINKTDNAIQNQIIDEVGTEDSAGKTIQDELYITDVENPNNYAYLIFKDNMAYLVRGGDKVSTTKLPGLVNATITKVDKILVGDGQIPKYINVDKDKTLIELVLRFKDGTTFRLLKDFRKTTT